MLSFAFQLLLLVAGFCGCCCVFCLSVSLLYRLLVCKVVALLKWLHRPDSRQLLLFCCAFVTVISGLTVLLAFNAVYSITCSVAAVSLKLKGGIFCFFLLMYCIQHRLICRPPDSTVSEDAGIEPRTVATLTLTARRSIYLARSHPHLARSHP